MMKKTVIFLCLLALVTVSQAQPKISRVSFSKEVAVYSLYEFSFNLGGYANPYDPEVIDVYAVFRSPEGKTFRVNGFYYEAYHLMQKDNIEVAARNGDNDGWKIRFTPDAVGRWTYEVHAVDRSGTAQLSAYKGTPLAFDCVAGDAQGFIRKANTRYLKREAFVNGKRKYRSFYPVGPNIAWYSTADYYAFKKPYGIYEYQRYIDSLTGNANYMRIWLNRYQYLSLYGPENVLRNSGRPRVYFDTEINQKDAAELDYIVSYAAEHGITLMPCVFNPADFRNDSEALNKCEQYNSMPSGWKYNPFHTVLGLQRPLEFFTDQEAIRITKNLLRYIIARWGYATNILCWELWNEVDNVFYGESSNATEKQAVLDWHATMAALFAEQDPYHHLLTTSTASLKGWEDFEKKIFNHLDLVQRHYYQNIQKAKSKEQVSQRLLELNRVMSDTYPSKLTFFGEFGFGSNANRIEVNTMDPRGVDLHNALWSSLFSGTAGPASYWRWSYLDEKDLFRYFRPMLTFCKSLPVLSETFTAMTTGEAQGSVMVFPNGLETYYMMNAAEDTLLGWAQDETFTYQALRRLTDEVGDNGHFVDHAINDPKGYVYTLDPAKKPRPSSKSNDIVIPMRNQRRGTQYRVRWFDAETGKEITSAATTVTVKNILKRKRHLALPFPESVRDVKNGRINNTFGDAVFLVYKIKG